MSLSLPVTVGVGVCACAEGNLGCSSGAITLFWKTRSLAGTAHLLVYTVCPVIPRDLPASSSPVLVLQLHTVLSF